MFSFILCYAEIFDLEDPVVVDNATDKVTESTCQVDFATINNVQPTLTNQPTLKDQLKDESVKSAIVLASVVGGILGLCVTFICIVGLIVIRNKRREDKVRKGVFTRQSLPVMFNRYITTRPIPRGVQRGSYEPPILIVEFYFHCIYMHSYSSRK